MTPNDTSSPVPTQPEPLKASLVLEDGTTYQGYSFGAVSPAAGEVVFNTGMVGYPEALTDPSYYGQILTFTYPLIGNYGIPDRQQPDGAHPAFESRRIQVKGLLVSEYSREHSHWQAIQSLSHWLQSEDVPALMGIDTRTLTKRLREKGTMLGKIEFPAMATDFFDPNSHTLVADVAITEPSLHGDGSQRVIVMDCGCKESIVHNLVSRGLQVKQVPWDHNLANEEFDGLMISSGPGEPKLCGHAIRQIRHAIMRDVPVFGICLGHQLLGLAIGADTYKLKYGHRSQNQPVMDVKTRKCYITSQNHGFAVDSKSLPQDWEVWFENLNDGTNEGIRHVSKPLMSVQFHPEASPGPVDTRFLFDEFVGLVRSPLHSAS